MSVHICAGSHLCEAAGTHLFCQLLMAAFCADFGEYSWDCAALFGKKSNLNFQTPLCAVRALHHRSLSHTHTHIHMQTRVFLNTHGHTLYSQQWLSRGINDHLMLNYASRPRFLWWGLTVAERLMDRKKDDGWK